MLKMKVFFTVNQTLFYYLLLEYQKRSFKNQNQSHFRGFLSFLVSTVSFTFCPIFISLFPYIEATDTLRKEKKFFGKKTFRFLQSRTKQTLIKINRDFPYMLWQKRLKAICWDNAKKSGRKSDGKLNGYSCLLLDCYQLIPVPGFLCSFSQTK